MALAHIRNGLRFKRTWTEGEGYRSSWQRTVTYKRLHMWVTIITTKGKITSIWDAPQRLIVR